MACGALLVADDDPRFRACVAALLGRAGYTVFEADTAERALEIAREKLPQAVLLDIQLPELGGYEVLQTLRDEFGERLAIAFVTGTRTESLDMSAGLLLGADDYIIKPFEPDEFLARIRTLLHHARTEPPSQSFNLTRRELEVLRLLAEGLEQAEIAQRLFISPKTVGRHIEHILVKLDVHSRSQAVALAYKQSLVESTQMADVSGP